MNLKVVFFMVFSFYIVSFMEPYDGEGVYQINNLEYSYTTGNAINDSVSYNINCEDDCILLIKEQGKDEKDKIKIKLSNKNMDKFESMLNRYHILSWKGFSKSDKNVLDGNSFYFRLRYNDDEKLSASGYMMYPNHYRDFKSAFESYVDDLK